ncbi:hypothetical protein COU76_00655 [Candidatus Peregrinibacteria bacterium CG10_big_fil_rev_8_21_14_0_10_49_10]|nr:MAG: hypothetical protein COU76_00655 [Candidatus Peregrinibacteria bacterium CG10_big_fil_rev_8_21_14_0_10_49_10]
MDILYHASVFYFFALTSMLAYALQSALLVRYARKIDGLSLAFYRNISFLVTLLPLLLFSSREEIALVLSYWPRLLLSGITGGVFLAFSFTAYRYIAVGVALTMKQASITILMTVVGVLLYAEALPPLAIALIGVIVGTCIWLSMMRMGNAPLNRKMVLGIVFSLVAAVPLIVTNITLIDISRLADPLTSGYFWEGGIGIGSLVIILLRSLLLKKGLQRIERKTLLRIAAASSPTIIGTGCYALALSMGPVSIVNAIASGSIMISALLAWRWYHEKLTRWQWLAMVLIVGAIAGLKFV